MKIFGAIKSFFKNEDPESKIKWSLYGRAWREFGRPYWKLLVLGILFTTAAAGAEAFSITLVKKVIDQGFIQKNMTSLFVIGLEIVGAFTAKGFFNYVRGLAMAKVGLMGITSLRRRVFNNMVSQSIDYFHKTHTGHLLNYFTSMASSVLSLVTGQITSIVHNIATVVMMLGLMIWYAPQMTVVLLFLVPAIIVPLVVIVRKKNVLTRRSYEVEANSITHITQSIEGIKTIQAFSNEDRENEKMKEVEDARVRVYLKSAWIDGLKTPVLETMISIGLCLALLIGGHFIANGSISTGDFAAFLLALTAAYKPAKALTNVNGGIQAGLIAAEKLFDFMDMKSDIADAPNAKVLKRAPMEVKLEHVRFAYDEKDGDVLKDVSLDIKPGQICAFVGPSGGGKSTIFNLLERFYDPQQGNVLINNTDVRKYTLKSLRDNISIVSQDVFLFSGTIAENIRYGNPRASDAQVMAAAKAANAHDFIMSFPDGYNSFVGERGTLLSGGQKQRIAIARAILRDTPILLLDEATSALDSESEKLIQSALNKLMKGRTTFVIAHRLATILDADVICVVKSGKIVERGTDAELYALGGDYAKLKDIQFKKKK